MKIAINTLILVFLLFCVSCKKEQFNDSTNAQTLNEPIKLESENRPPSDITVSLDSFLVFPTVGSYESY